MTRKKIPKPQVPLHADAEEKIRQLEQQLAYEKLRADALDTMINIAEKQLNIDIRKSLAPNSPTNETGKSTLQPAVALPAVRVFQAGLSQTTPV